MEAPGIQTTAFIFFFIHINLKRAPLLTVEESNEKTEQQKHFRIWGDLGGEKRSTAIGEKEAFTSYICNSIIRKSALHCSQGSHWPNHHVHLHQAAEQGTCGWCHTHRFKFKFPGCQRLHISKKWGFPKFTADGFEGMVDEKWLIPNNHGVKYIPNLSPLDKWQAPH